ncbi:MAG: cadherin repeat domain-containing protein, partial [Sphingomicrobium sp.]
MAIDLAGPGGTVIMLADKGAYNVATPVNIYNGGSASAPVTVMGADSSGQPMNIVINGDRPANYSPTNNPGSDVFRLLAGADNLAFENMTFNNVGTPFRVGADISNLTIEHMTADNVRKFFEDYASGTETTATISGLTIRDVDVAGFSKGVIRLQYDTNGVVIDDVHGDSEYQDGDGIAMGVHLEGTVHDVMISNSSMDNAIASHLTYWNGDGFASERDVYNVTLKDCSASGNADGGFDLKSSSTTLINPVAEGNAHNYRFWGQIDVINPIGIDPTKQGGSGSQYQIQFLDGAVVTITGGHFADSGSDTVLVLNNAGTSITFNGTEFYHAAGGKISVGGGIYGLNNVISVDGTGAHSTNGWVLIGPIDSGSGTAVNAPSDLTLSASTVGENAAYGTVVGTIGMPDPTGTGVCTYKLSDDAGGAFAIDPKTGLIKVINSGLLNFENSAGMAITAVVTNSLGSYTETFQVGVLDCNEAPDSLVVTGGKVVENAAAGTVVATVSGHDPDALDALTYKLVDNAGNRFVINAVTGVVTVAQGAVIDFEQAQSITLSVAVTDAAGLTLIKPLVIAVSDVAEANLPMTGTAGNDVLTGTATTDYAVSGLAGNDQITTGA